MELNHDFENISERYLLGELSEQEQQQFEESYFADDTLFERFLAVKHDLVDAYARGDLAANKRERFEQHFLASQPRRQRVDEAKQFIRAVTKAAPNIVTISTDDASRRSNTWWRQFTASTFIRRPLVWQGVLATLLLVTLATSWVLIRRFQSQRAERERLQNEETLQRKQEEERRRAVLPPANDDKARQASKAGANVNASQLPFSPGDTTQAKKANKQSRESMPSQVASLFLVPFSARDGSGSNSLLLGPNTRAVSLRLAFKGEDYRRYDAVLRTLDGEQLLSRQGLKPTTNRQGKSVTLVVDPAIFRHQDYILTINGLRANGQIETIGDYSFNVKRSTP